MSLLAQVTLHYFLAKPDDLELSKWILLCVLLMASRTSSAAPAPIPKPIQYHPVSLVGIWKISWGSSAGEMTLHPDGQYWCQLGERQWIGTWRVEDEITSSTECVYGVRRDEPGMVEIVLESATQYGITAYRWMSRDDSSWRGEGGPVTLSKDEAILAGKTHAEENDDEPDAEDCIRKIVETGYFGDADADDIRAICKAATEYSQGYLLLAAGEFCGHPIGRMWTMYDCLQCDEYVTLDATHPSISYAAHFLLRTVTSSGEE